MLNSFGDLRRFGLRIGGRREGQLVDLRVNAADWRVGQLVATFGGQQRLVGADRLGRPDLGRREVPVAALAPDAGRAPFANPEGAGGLHGLAALVSAGVAARDGALGRVTDVLLDTLAWQVAALVVATDRGGAGAEVAVDADRVLRIDGAFRTVRLAAHRAEVEAGPVPGALPDLRRPGAEGLFVRERRAPWPVG